MDMETNGVLKETQDFESFCDALANLRLKYKNEGLSRELLDDRERLRRRYVRLRFVQLPALHRQLERVRSVHNWSIPLLAVRGPLPMERAWPLPEDAN